MQICSHLCKFKVINTEIQTHIADTLPWRRWRMWGREFASTATNGYSAKWEWGRGFLSPLVPLAPRQISEPYLLGLPAVVPGPSCCSRAPLGETDDPVTCSPVARPVLSVMHSFSFCPGAALLTHSRTKHDNTLCHGLTSLDLPREKWEPADAFFLSSPHGMFWETIIYTAS